MRSEDGYGAPEERYPLEYLDGVFCELCLTRVLRTSPLRSSTKVGSTGLSRVSP
jgi:hypothetical protein